MILILNLETVRQRLIRSARAVLLVFGVALAVASCGSGGSPADVAATAETPSQTSESEVETEASSASIVVSTNILGDVVNNLVGDTVAVDVIMPVGTDPHDFQASAQQVARIESADVLIVNGAGFEEGLLDIFEAAKSDGVATFAAMDAVAALEFGDDDHDEHGDEDHDDHGDEDHGDEDHDDHGDEDHDEHADEDHDEHADEDHDEHGDEDHDEHGDEDHDDHGDEDHDEHGDEDHDEHGDEDRDEHGDEDHDDEDHSEHAHGGTDPHFFTDPASVATAAEAITDFLVVQLAEADGVDIAALEANAAAYIAELKALDGEVEAILAEVPAEQRVLVTNHEVFGYFAERYDFEVVGTVIPAGTTTGGADAQQLAELVEIVEHENVAAIFADTSSSDELAQVLADEVGDIAVVELFSESLGDADSDGATYVDMIRANAQRIASALTAGSAP